MKSGLFRFLLITALALAPVSAVADDDEHERDDINAAVRKGEFMQLSEILKRVKPRIKGKILEIEFEYERGLPLYEIYVLDEHGRRLEYEIDARTGEIVGLDDED